MKQVYSFVLFALLSILVQIPAAYSQKSDSTGKKLFRPNNIKINLTSNILYSPSIIFSYERSVAQYKTFSVEGGYVHLPQIIKTLPDDLIAEDVAKQSGFKAGGDFRFYLQKENKYTAPHGLYVGPFLAYYHFVNQRTLSGFDSSFATGNLDLNASLNSYQIGAQLGYQFMLIKNRLSIDMVLIGPALAYYNAKLELTGNFDANEENKYLQDLLNFLIDSFPLFGDLVKNKEINANGRADLFFAGFRYSVSAGFRF